MGENTISDAELADFRVLEAHEVPEQILQYAEMTLEPADIQALNATPKNLVPAPEAGKVLEFVSACFMLKWGSIAYATNGDLTIQNETGTALSNTILLANLLAAVANKIVQVGALDTADAGIVLLPGEAIQIACATGDPTAGDSPVRVVVAYRVHETGF